MCNKHDKLPTNSAQCILFTENYEIKRNQTGCIWPYSCDFLCELLPHFFTFLWLWWVCGTLSASSWLPLLHSALQGTYFDTDYPEHHPGKPLYCQSWTPLSHASYHSFLYCCIGYPCPFWPWGWSLHCIVFLMACHPMTTITSAAPVNRASHVHQWCYNTSKISAA